MKALLALIGLGAVGYWFFKPKEHIYGGKAAGRADSDFDPIQLAMGTKIEMEHTYDPRIAKEIAKDHLVERPDYYSILIREGL